MILTTIAAYHKTLAGKERKRAMCFRLTIIPLIFMLLWGCAACAARAELVMDTHGMVSFAPYIHGMSHTYDIVRASPESEKTKRYYPAYRATFLANIDLYRWNHLVLTGTASNITAIAATDSAFFNLNRIHYIVSPGFRYEFPRFVVRGSFHHESVFSLSRPEHLDRRKGPYWQNSIRLGVGSLGSYYLFLRDEYAGINNRLVNSFDAQINGGVFLHGSESIWISKNNPYRYEEFSLLRYHFGVFRNWAYFATFRQFLWVRLDHKREHNLNITLNAFRKGAVHFFGLYYTYTIYDNSTEDNEDRLGAMGLRVVF